MSDWKLEYTQEKVSGIMREHMWAAIVNTVIDYGGGRGAWQCHTCGAWSHWWLEECIICGTKGVWREAEARTGGREQGLERAAQKEITYGAKDVPNVPAYKCIRCGHQNKE